jgi:hypothetical protein
MNAFLKISGSIIGLFIVVGLILPNEVNIQRNISINAPIETIHSNVSDLNNWPLWSPWIEQDPTIKTTLGDISQGVGASQVWHGTGGSGQLKLTESSLIQGVLYDMSFDGDSTVYQAGFSYQLDDNSDQVVVTWTMKGEMSPIIIGNYFALFMDSLIGDSFSQGLEKLKRVSEGH